MGNFNEYQHGMPDLGKNYWQDLYSKDVKDTNTLNKIVEMNCKTIFSPEDFKNTNE